MATSVEQMAIEVRPLCDEDLGELAAVAVRVHEHDGYPARLPADITAWLRCDRARASWVATAGGRVVGHVSRAVAEGDGAVDVWCRATGRPAHELSVVKRLFVDPSAQGRGTGVMLLAAVVADAHRLGLQPVLDVDARSRRARRLYEEAGFDYVGDVELPWGCPGVFLAACYVGPPARRPNAEGET